MIQQGQCTIFKQNCLSGLENFTTGGQVVISGVATSVVYKIALYTALADLGPSTLTYTSDGEITGTGYTAGGQVLTVIPPASLNQTSYLSFENVTWDPANFTARGALIYNSTTNAAVAVLDFGSDKIASNTFTITFPADTAADAVIRFSI